MRIEDARGWIGRTIGDCWRIDDVIGRGGTSIVYGATNIDDDSRVALKVLHPKLASDPGIVKIFLAEAKLGQTVKHPGIVRVLDEGTTHDGEFFLVMELLAGQTLEELRQARGGRVPIDEMMRIGHALMDCLIAVHAGGVVHRDLKPSNVFVLEGGGVKLLDFGVAKVAGRTADAAQSVVGTPSFMPPEQALGLTSKVDEQSDVWSLGAMLFQCLSGQPVHTGKHLDAVMLASASTRPRSLADAAPELFRGVIAVVDRALSYRKADRWSDIAAMREAWLEAHPHWLPTLPPPSFSADPEFLDNGLLVPAGKGTGMFDPREILKELRAEPAPARPRIATLADDDVLVAEAETKSVKSPTPATAIEIIAPISPAPKRKLSRFVLIAGAAFFLAVTAVSAAVVVRDQSTSRR